MYRSENKKQDKSSHDDQKHLRQSLPPLSKGEHNLFHKIERTRLMLNEIVSNWRRIYPNNSKGIGWRSNVINKPQNALIKLNNKTLDDIGIIDHECRGHIKFSFNPSDIHNYFSYSLDIKILKESKTIYSQCSHGTAVDKFNEEFKPFQNKLNELIPEPDPFAMGRRKDLERTHNFTLSENDHCFGDEIKITDHSVFITYASMKEQIFDRIVDVKKVIYWNDINTEDELKGIIGFCHLRQKERTFSFERILKMIIIETGEIIDKPKLMRLHFIEILKDTTKPDKE